MFLSFLPKREFTQQNSKIKERSKGRCFHGKVYLRTIHNLIVFIATHFLCSLEMFGEDFVVEMCN
jgi:hypothetical protein